MRQSYTTATAAVAVAVTVRAAAAAVAVVVVVNADDVRNAPRSDDFRLETGSSMTPPWSTKRQAAERAEMRGGV